MKTKNQIEKCWTEIDSERSSASSYAIRRIISDEALHRIFIGMIVADGVKILVLEYPIDLSDIFRKTSDTKGYNVERKQFGDEAAGCHSLVLVSKSSMFDGIFTAVSTNIIERLEMESDPKIYVSAIVERLEVWRRFFLVEQQSFSESKKIGLYAELRMLQRILQMEVPRAVDCWKGPEGHSHDFELPNISIEVKGTAGPARKVGISSERQLEYKVGSKLYFNILLLRKNDQNGPGETLPDLVANLGKLISDPLERLTLSDKLLLYGLDVTDKSLENTRYEIVSTQDYLVDEYFPRLTTSFIPAGVTDITYSIQIDALSKWKNTLEFQMEHQEGNENG